MKPPKAVRDYMAKIGAEGGKKGGTAKGKRKARPPEHYQKMAEARKAKRQSNRPVIEQKPKRIFQNPALYPKQK